MKFDPKSRYYDQGGIEVQEIIKAKLTPEQYRGFCLGNIIKYSCRANFKGGFKRDLEKVGFYQSFLSDGQSREKKPFSEEILNAQDNVTIRPTLSIDDDPLQRPELEEWAEEVDE